MPRVIVIPWPPPPSRRPTQVGRDRTTGGRHSCSPTTRTFPRPRRRRPPAPGGAGVPHLTFEPCLDLIVAADASMVSEEIAEEDGEARFSAAILKAVDALAAEELHRLEARSLTAGGSSARRPAAPGASRRSRSVSPKARSEMKSSAAEIAHHRTPPAVIGLRLAARRWQRHAAPRPRGVPAARGLGTVVSWKSRRSCSTTSAASSMPATPTA